MASFDFKGCRLFYDVKGAGRDMVLLHGLGADRRQLQALNSSIEGYRVITVDMPGHGESLCHNPEFFSFPVFAQATLALLDHLNIQSAVWGGISMGCGISLAAALQQKHRVDALFLIRPAWLDTPALPHLNLVAEVGEWISEQGLERAQNHLDKASMYEQAMDINPAAAESIRGLLSRPQAVKAAGVLSALVMDYPIESLSLLDTLYLPTCVIGNYGDPLHPHSIAKTIASTLPLAHYQHLPSRYLNAAAHQRELVQSLLLFLDEVCECPVEAAV